MQLVAYGAQDIYLTGNPQITFFKVVYRRHTNFSMESIEQTFNGSSDFGKKVTCTVSRNGDLIHRVYLQVNIGTVAGNNSVMKFANDQKELHGKIIDVISENKIKLLVNDKEIVFGSGDLKLIF